METHAQRLGSVTCKLSSEFYDNQLVYNIRLKDIVQRRNHKVQLGFDQACGIFWLCDQSHKVHTEHVTKAQEVFSL